MLSWFLPNVSQPIHMPHPPWTSFPPRTSHPTPTPSSNLNSSIWYIRPSIILVLSVYWFSFLHIMIQYMFWLVYLLLLVTEWLLRFRKQFQYLINSSIIYLHAYLELILLYQVPRKANSDQFSSVAQLCPTLATPWTAAHQASLSITNSQSLPKLMSVESVMPSNHLILCRPLLLLPSIFPNIRVFSNESVLCIMWPKYWTFIFSISSYN